MDLENRYPALDYLVARARARIPHFAWEYLDSGTGSEALVDRNRAALDAVELTPRILGGRYEPDMTTELFGHSFSVPFGAGPVGMSGLIWPGAELIIARAARSCNMPYCLSMVANETPEAVAELAGENAWFQLYVPRQEEVMQDLMRRVRAAGIRTLVVTVDVPVGSRRERQLAAGLTVPPKVTPLTLYRIAKRPNWALSTLRHGQPRFRTLESYFATAAMSDSAKMVGTIIDGRPDWDTLQRIRDAWAGTLIIKGILNANDAVRAVEAGTDGIVVSNHGGRQFDAAPAAIEVLPAIAGAVRGRVPVLFDSGLRWGADIIRALSLGADFCLLGRGFLIAVAALGEAGAEHAYSVLRKDLENNMIQLGTKTVSEIRAGRGHD